jgi:predicted kinase
MSAKKLKPVLFVLVGLPYSGKSVWARHYGAPIVCPDEIRRALHGERYLAKAEPFVWAIAHVMVDALFRSGHKAVTLDATNTTQKRRDEWLNPSWDVRLVHINTSEEVCRARALEAGDTGILPIIEKMAEQFEDPDCRDGGGG